MRLFACDQCRAPIYFENFRCVSCQHPLAFLPDLARMSTLEELPDAETAVPSEQSTDDAASVAATAAKTAAIGDASAPTPAAGDAATAEDAAEADAAAAKARSKRYRALIDGRVVRMCQNHVDFAACNWAVAETDPEPLCLACRLNDVIPDLSKPGLHEAWRQLEAAKRRLLYSLYQLKLPVEGREEEAEGGLRFAFLSGEKEQPVFTGHNDGLITINVAEADDPFREKMRARLGEAYRTVLGHFRHEIGHYYWDRLIKDSAWLPKYRELFGDETQDYGEALERHYKEGAPADWAERYVSQYASMHPWEDWAETWAHYLHIFDTLGTAKAYGLRVVVGKGSPEGEKVVNTEEVSIDDFEGLTQDWVPLTLALNSLNRSMGLRDVYPFVLTPMALKKLRFVHQVINAPPPARSARRRHKKLSEQVQEPRAAQPASEP
jgi:hypothetical protein